MIYCLDTNVVVHTLRGRGEKVVKQLKKRHPDEIKIPSVVRAELILGAMKSDRLPYHLKRVKAFLEPFEELTFGGVGCEVYAKVRADLEKKGEVIDPNDLLIAATVVAHGGTLVTGNVKEFRRVSGLKVVDWLGR